jgi:hypothetical protein
LPYVSDTTASAPIRQELAAAAVIQLNLFDSEISYLLTDTHANIRAHCERAFEHLRRLVVVDPAQKALWQAAYAEGEVACEKLAPRICCTMRYGSSRPMLLAPVPTLCIQNPLILIERPAQRTDWC